MHLNKRKTKILAISRGNKEVCVKEDEINIKQVVKADFTKLRRNAQNVRYKCK